MSPRGRPPFRSRARLDVLDVVALGLVPGIVAAVITGAPGAAPAIATFVLFGIAIIYALVALGIPELTGWGYAICVRTCRTSQCWWHALFRCC